VQPGNSVIIRHHLDLRNVIFRSDKSHGSASFDQRCSINQICGILFGINNRDILRFIVLDIEEMFLASLIRELIKCRLAYENVKSPDCFDYHWQQL